MRRNSVLCPHLGALDNAETMLLVNDHKTKIAEFDIILEYSMRAYKNIYLTIFKRLEQRISIFCLCAAGEQFHPHGQCAQHSTQGSEMLFGKNLCRCKHAGLVAVVLRQ